MLTIMKGMMETHGEPERGLSVIFETLRARDGWYDEICSSDQDTALVVSGSPRKKLRRAIH